MRRGINTLFVLTVIATGLAGGCVSSARRAPNGKTYYVGGAGNIGPFGTGEIALALQFAGYDGQYEPFIWQSGRGAYSDQLTYDRNKMQAELLAEKIKLQSGAYPGAEINLIALSAGCGIATFALEDLPPGVHVNNVVFLGCSLSSRYDLSKMLKHVDGSVYVYTSPSDLVLSKIVPYTGTIDQGGGSTAAGLYGFQTPVVIEEADRLQYRKVIQIPYRTEFRKYGYFGQHLDTVGYGFVRYEIAPRIMTPPLRWSRNKQLVQRPAGGEHGPRPTTRPADPAANGAGDPSLQGAVPRDGAAQRQTQPDAAHPQDPYGRSTPLPGAPPDPYAKRRPLSPDEDPYPDDTAGRRDLNRDASPGTYDPSALPPTNRNRNGLPPTRPGADQPQRRPATQPARAHRPITDDGANRAVTNTPPAGS